MQALTLRGVDFGLSTLGTQLGASYRWLGSWATVDPTKMSGGAPAVAQNLVSGRWVGANREKTIPDPLNGQAFIRLPDTSISEIKPFVLSLQCAPKTGLHNPLKNPHRYLMYGDISAKVAAELAKPDVAEFFAKLIQRVAPKSYPQAMAEVTVTQKFFENFSGDQVRFLARGFSVPGDRYGQQSNGYRFPFGPVAIVTPFNFPLEIPALQLMGALYMGNRPLLHVDQKVSIVAEQLVRLLQQHGMPSTDMDMVHGAGLTVGEILKQAQPRSTLFTGSQAVAEKLCADLNGKVFLEDAGFDWKILGPDVSELDYVAWQCDQDAYACSGQKCSAQSILFMHSNWEQAGLVDRMRSLAAGRNLQDLTIGPVLTWNTEKLMKHTARLLAIPGAKLLFGGKPLSGHTIPACYGAIEPTAVFVPLEAILQPGIFEAVTTEVFGPFQVVTEYNDRSLQAVLSIIERMSHNLTAAVVSNDVAFTQSILANTINGTTYAGIRARTTGAPQNHWFGPAGDPRAAGIGTPEAIKLVWSCHREIITDVGPVPKDIKLATS